MTEHALPLITFYGGWADYQQALVKMIAPLSPHDLAQPTSDHHWSIGMVLQHMIADRVWWYHGWMDQGSPSLAPIMQWDPNENAQPPTLTADELVDGLEQTWQMIHGALTTWTAADLDLVFVDPPFLSEEQQQDFGACSRRWIVWHVMQHEIHHGGELSLALGTRGFRGIY